MNVIVDIAAIVVSIGTILGARWSLQAKREVSRNGGASLKDSTIRQEDVLSLVLDQVHRLAHQLEQVRGDLGRSAERHDQDVERLDGALAEVRRDLRQLS